jgi:Heterokaryon incompatibility protein (HET)
MEGSFLYRPLDLDPQSRQLRFLHLLPAQRFDDDIHCTIFHGSLQDRPSYEALSYVWGSEENKPSIHLSYVPEQTEGASEAQDEENPKLTSKKSVPIQVTQNLFVALRHIRLPDVSRTMWIDAICINQSLTDEKAHQVKQMRQVYLLSQRVVLWLGEEENSSIAINFLRDMPLQQNGDAAYSWNKNDITKWTACDDLFLKRPYWGRSWILQEVLHDKDVIVYIGLQTLTIEELFALFKKYLL